MAVVEFASVKTADVAARSRELVASLYGRFRRHDVVGHAPIVIALSSRRQYDRLCLGCCHDTRKHLPSGGFCSAPRDVPWKGRNRPTAARRAIGKRSFPNSLFGQHAQLAVVTESSAKPPLTRRPARVAHDAGRGSGRRVGYRASLPIHRSLALRVKHRAIGQIAPSITACEPK
jgi:hypothetical protein